MPGADSYSTVERRFVEPVRELLLWLYGPVVRLLAAAGVSPHAVSLVGPVLGALFVHTVRDHPQLSFFIWLASMMTDSVDGALARYTGRASHFGALLDQFADHTRETLIVVGLAASGALSPLWGSLYPFVYTALNVVLFLGNQYGVPAPIAIKSWMVLYPAIVLYLLGGRNYLDTAAMLSIAFMSATILHGLLLLSREMDRGL
ncbi:MAG: CDP-alcohol phosphatidyltransferase family protein [Chloroflexi bacterium]|nr:CDP-alcohol phosphatidyltransferase family protein [Chloroflexota bacterium]